MPSVSGTVYDSIGDPVAGRVVRVYRRDTGAFIAAGLSSSGVVGGNDPYYSDLEVLFRGEGTPGSAVIADESPFARTYTATGNVTISGAQFKHGATSVRVQGVSSLVATTGSTSYGTDDLTIAGYVFLPATASTQLDLRLGNESTDRLFIYTDSARKLVADRYGFGPFAYSFNAIPSGVMTHFGVTITGGNIYLFIGGTLELTAAFTSPVGNAGPISINGASGADYFFDDLHVTRGVARWTSSFTPPGEIVLPSALSIGQYSIDLAGYSGEVNVVCLDDVAGTTENDLILRTTGV